MELLVTKSTAHNIRSRFYDFVLQIFTILKHVLILIQIVMNSTMWLSVN